MERQPLKLLGVTNHADIKDKSFALEIVNKKCVVGKAPEEVEDLIYVNFEYFYKLAKNNFIENVKVEGTELICDDIQLDKHEEISMKEMHDRIKGCTNEDDVYNVCARVFYNNSLIAYLAALGNNKEGIMCKFLVSKKTLIMLSQKNKVFNTQYVLGQVVGKGIQLDQLPVIELPVYPRNIV